MVKGNADTGTNEQNLELTQFSLQFMIFCNFSRIRFCNNILKEILSKNLCFLVLNRAYYGQAEMTT